MKTKITIGLLLVSVLLIVGCGEQQVQQKQESYSLTSDSIFIKNYDWTTMNPDCESAKKGTLYEGQIGVYASETDLNLNSAQLSFKCNVFIDSEKLEQRLTRIYQGDFQASKLLNPYNDHTTKVCCYLNTNTNNVVSNEICDEAILKKIC